MMPRRCADFSIPAALISAISEIEKSSGHGELLDRDGSE
jgi:hypothetical protein